jgi:hypothetical protein
MRVIDASMDNFAAPRTYSGSERRFGVKHQSFVPLHGKPPRAGQTHYTGTNHNDLC